MNLISMVCIVMLVFLLLKVPVFISIIIPTIIYFIFTPNLTTMAIVQRYIAGVESIPLLAVPFFVFSGILMNYSGVTKRIMDFAELLTGRMYGGLAQVNVLLSTLMGGLSGSNLADTAMEAKMLVPEMKKHGFSNEFSSVVTAASSLITPMIPPGIAMILYGSVTNTSIGQLFIAGIGPGLLMCITMMFLVSVISRKRGYEKIRNSRATGKEIRDAVKRAFFPLCLPVIIIGGIRIGVFTPTEAGAISIVYAVILGLAYRELTWQHFIESLKEIIKTTASIMLIVGASSAFAWILTRERIPQTITENILIHINNKYVFLIGVNVFLLIVGMFIEGGAATIVLAPLLAPAAAAFGIDPIQFGMIVIFNLAIGCLTPLLGTVMFVTCQITGCRIDKFTREAVPFFVLFFIMLLLLTYFPIFSTFFVNLLY